MATPKTIFMDWGVFFVVEVAAEAARRLVPSGLPLIETASGAALLSVNVVHFLGGGDGVDLTQNHEIDIGVATPADNAEFEGLPQAAAATFVLNIASTSQAYLGHCRDSGYPAHSSGGVRFDLGRRGLKGRVLDGDGEILSFACTTSRPAFAPFSRTGQDVVHDHRGGFRLNYVFSGEGLAAPGRDVFDLVLHDHPFFRGVPAAGCGRTPRENFALRPGRRSAIAFYGPNAGSADPET